MKRFMLVMLLAVLGIIMVMGATYEHKEGGLSIWFPDNWKTTPDEDILEAEAPGGEAYAQLMMLEDEESIDEAVDSLIKELEPIIEDFKLTNEGLELENNGLKFYIVEGEGKVDAVKMGVSVALIGTKKNQVGMMILFCPDAVYKKYEKDFDKIIQSIKAI